MVHLIFCLFYYRLSICSFCKGNNLQKKGANKRPFQEGNTELNKLINMIDFSAFGLKTINILIYYISRILLHYLSFIETTKFFVPSKKRFLIVNEFLLLFGNITIVSPFAGIVNFGPRSVIISNGTSELFFMI